MDEDKNKTPQGEGTPNTPDNEGKQGGKGEDTPKTFTQEELNETLSKRLAREKEAFEKKLAKEVADAKKEAERLAKLSAEEKEKELREQQAQELEQKSKELTLRENKLEGIDKLSELKIPIKFVEFVLNVDKSKMEANIETFAKEWTEAVAKEVKKQLKGDTPKDPKNNNSGAVEVKTTF